ncbi:cob(I)yrinic acid a,c-diamide adenosyltransferase [Radiobacillus deserti]|uniref:Corrinoid adenosyltransferase n=1 Tax=Radiobacillus deserti TaxID=2594883 RepID=A0A516KDF8_9BACI|nr:cob(I)yrinic acid a,c-diamide adenosyltransferase [Radiobacillus deserti]QDP39429.1 cob(I)yrinic acid a,c-diamide adenosyltransferase [Radiobacillus deserti]
MRIYTRSGDKGTTSLLYGKRVAKHDIRVEAYGTCDEANSIIGVAVSHMQAVDFDGKCKFIKALQRVQTILFHVGSELATPSNKEVLWKLTQTHVEELEQQIDAWDASLPELKNFILPSGTLASTTLHTARTIVRRAERCAVAIGEEEKHSLAIAYLNRLSDFLFVAARYVNVKTGGTELPLEVD